METIMLELINWLEDHLDGSFSLEKLSKAMGYSPYYCSFKFKQITGISLKRYLLMRKMYLAATKLSTSSEPILAIAHDYGYTSQAAFSRSFKTIFGVSPYEFRQDPQPWQTFPPFQLTGNRAATIDFSQKLTLEQLQKELQQANDSSTLNILNCEMMYHEFASKELMGSSDYVPFNEAMAVHPTTEPIFSPEFNQIRAEGHQVSLLDYQKITLDRLDKLFNQTYDCLILWFGDDMFCQLNLITLLAYLEQVNYLGEIYYNVIHEATYELTTTKITLGNYQTIYHRVLCQKELPSEPLIPVMYQGIKWYLTLQEKENDITDYIKKNLHLSTNELVQHLLDRFPQIGLGDTQYEEMINKEKTSP